MRKNSWALILALILFLATVCICVGWMIEIFLPSKIARVACAESISVARETNYSEILTDNVIVQLEDSRLMQYTEGNSQCLIEGVASFCWDGSYILYLNKDSGCVYTIDSQTPSALFTIDLETAINTYSMLASSKWIVLRGMDSLHIYHRDLSTLRSLPLQSDINGSDAFIIENKLICVGGAKELFTIVDLTTGGIDTIDVGMETIQCPTTASCAYDGNKAYLSVRIRSWPDFGIKFDDGTYVIDLTNLQIEKLSDNYYKTLYFKDNYLYGE